VEILYIRVSFYRPREREIRRNGISSSRVTDNDDELALDIIGRFRESRESIPFYSTVTLSDSVERFICLLVVPVIFRTLHISHKIVYVISSRRIHWMHPCTFMRQRSDPMLSDCSIAVRFVTRAIVWLRFLAIAQRRSER